MSQAKIMIQDIEQAVLDEEINLNEWETDFFENVKRRVEEGRELTDPQEESLTKIWNRIK
jgi:hypothetical protein